MGELWIGVTGFCATDNPDPGLAVARALGDADPSWRILALLFDRAHVAALAPAVDAVALVPPADAKPAAVLERLRAIVRHQPLDLLIPTLDAELGQYVALRASLRRLGIATVLPSARALDARTKIRLPALGLRAGVRVPATIALTSEAAVASAAARVEYPQVLKGALVDSAVAHWPEDFRAIAREIARRWGYPVLTQPLVPGEEYGVAAVARRGEIVGAAVMKKLGATNKGSAWAGVTVEAPDLVERSARLAEALRWDGPLEVEFLRDGDGEAHCFEINPSFPPWITLAADAGANLPAQVVRLARGEEVKPLRARPGRMFARAVAERVLLANPLAALGSAVAARNGDHDSTTDLIAARNGLGGRPTPGRRRRGGVIAITGLNAADNPSPGLSVARCLRASALASRLVGLTHEVLATGAYVADVWDEVRLLPFPSRDDSGWADALLGQCREAGVDCLVPTLDVEVPLVSWLAPRLAAAGVATLVPDIAAVTAAAKYRLPELAARGFRLPRTEWLYHPDAVAAVARRFGYPFVVKGLFADARVVDTEEAARLAARRLAAFWGWPVLAQEFVEGRELAVAAVADRRHRVAAAVVVRKEIQTMNGNTWGGTAVAEPSLVRLAEHFAATLSWTGPFELEVIRHARRGNVLIEANPRFPGWILLSAGAGVNLPDVAVRLARGERVMPGSPRAATYLRMAWDVTTSVDQMGILAAEGRMRHGDA